MVHSSFGGFETRNPELIFLLQNNPVFLKNLLCDLEDLELTEYPVEYSTQQAPGLGITLLSQGGGHENKD